MDRPSGEPYPPRGLWRHYRGSIVQVLFLAVDASNRWPEGDPRHAEEVVVYVTPLAGGLRADPPPPTLRIHARPVSEWYALVESSAHATITEQPPGKPLPAYFRPRYTSIGDVLPTGFAPRGTSW